MKHSAQKKRSAFTLIEIMVATVIMVILVGLVIQITSEVLKVWNRSSGKLSANAEARIAMDLLTQDIETAVFRDNGLQWLRVEGPSTVGGPFDAGQTVALKLFSPALDRDQSEPGDICAIGYQLAYGPAYQGATDQVYALYRHIVSPKDTFDNLMGPDSSDPSRQEALTGGEWDSIVVEENYLVGNIVEFKVLVYVDEGDGTSELINADEDTLELSQGTYSYGGDNSGGNELIEDPLLYAEVILTVMSDEGLQLLQRFDEIGGGFDEYTDVDDIIREHGQTFNRRVNFVVRPL